jgi:hypothetical protein
MQGEMHEEMVAELAELAAFSISISISISSGPRRAR